jgi:DNA-nicking Smr family endonuclease
MKKEKKPEKKSVEFSVKPFRALKSFQTESKAPEGAVPVVEPPPPPPSDDDDAAIFRRAVANVKRLHPAGNQMEKKKKAVPVERKLEEEERSVFLKEVERLQLDVKFRDELPDDVTPLRKPASNRQRELKKGAIRIGLELDLHGLTREEALTSLERFISGAYNRDQNAVLVITGKGNNSPEEPVLQMAVSAWLRDRGRGMVAEFAPAPRQLGGSGAFVVFLKEREIPSSNPS